MKANQRAFTAAEQAVSDMVGNVLLVAITVIMAAALGLTVFALTTPIDPLHADLSLLVLAGDDGWQSGDEIIRLRHLGGEDVGENQTTIRYTLLGSTTEISGTALGGAFSDGTFSIGETWERVLTIPEGADVDVDVIVITPGGASQQIATLNLSTDCDADTAPPLVLQWTEDPLDLTSTHTANSGDFEVTAVVTDLCSGVDESTPPRLFFKVGVDPEASVAMTGGGGTWTGVIPDQGWSSSAGEALQYWLSPLTDSAGNTGNSTVQSETIDDGSLLFPVEATVTFTAGSVDAVGPARLWDDAGAFSTFAEAVASSTVEVVAAGTATVESGTWTPSGNLATIGTALDGNYVSTTSNNGELLVPFADPAGDPGDITKIEIHVLASIDGASGTPNDAFVISACKTGVASSCDAGTTIVGPTTDTYLEYEVAGAGTDYSWSDVRAMAASVGTDQVAGRDGTWRIDQVRLEVTYTPYNFDAEFAFPTLPSGSSYEVQIQYNAPNEDFNVEAKIGTGGTATYLPCGTLTGGPSLTCSFTPAQITGPLGLRIRDLDAVGTQGYFEADYIRVKVAP